MMVIMMAKKIEGVVFFGIGIKNKNKRESSYYCWMTARQVRTKEGEEMRQEDKGGGQ